MQAWFISDVHIKDINERNSVLLLRFLRFLEDDKSSTHLILLGDIFDLWVGDSYIFEKKFRPIVDAISRLKDRGMEVIYFEGNHDLHVKRYWENRFSIPVHVDFQLLKLGKWVVRAEHGDYINPEDLAYLKYLSIVRSKKMETFAHSMPGLFFDVLGNFASKTSRKHSTHYRKDSEQDLRNKIRKYAMKSSESTQFDYIITGHMHIKDEYLFSNGSEKKVSINLGSWFDDPQALCLMDAGHVWKKVSEI